MRSQATADSTQGRDERVGDRSRPGVIALRLIAVQSTLASVALHLLWGLPRAAIYIQTGTIADPRPYLFVVSGVTLLGAVSTLYLDVRYPTRAQVYGLCAGILTLYIVGYAWWHLGGHGGMIPGVRGYGHSDLSNLGVLFSDAHLYRPLDLASMIVDSLGLGGFLALLAFDR